MKAEPPMSTTNFPTRFVGRPKRTYVPSCSDKNPPSSPPDSRLPLLLIRSPVLWRKVPPRSRCFRRGLNLRSTTRKKL